MAEREGFRTLDGLLTHTHFPGERLRPLGHRSALHPCPSGDPGALILRRLEGRALGKRGAGGKLACRVTCGLGFDPLCRAGMTRRFDQPPTSDEIAEIARAAMAGLPEPFAAHLTDVVLAVEEEADADLLAEMGIEHPLDLSGLYEGLPIGERSVSHSGTLPDRIRLFRRASSTSGSRRARRSSISCGTSSFTKSGIISASATRTCIASRKRHEPAQRSRG